MSSTTLTPGTRLGPYEIVDLLGVGGMGEVYRATDTNLKRQVAIKVLPSAVAADSDRLARFQREAEVLAVLNHPNIAHIFGLEKTGGTIALVMELVEGPTLADRIAQGAIPLAEALPIARQIAEALEAAHEQGIIHRDLKPANIKIRPDGAVKVLDFGLAKVIDPAGASSANAMNSPTLSMHATQAGIVLGTAAYMSPEQAKGKLVDRRADIWAFGVVLFEMLTGKRAFEGTTLNEILASVLKTDPDWRLLPAETPEAIRRLLRRCLQRDDKLRLRDIGEARLEIDELPTAPQPHGHPVGGAARHRERVILLSALALVAFIAVVASLRAFRPAPSPTEVRFEVTTPPTTVPSSLAIAPDGQKIVFVAESEGRLRLWLRPLDSVVARPLTGTDAAQYPFWSPDSGSVGFFADGKLKRIDLEGGSVQTVANAPRGTGGAWGRRGLMLFATPGTPIFSVPDTGGEPVAVTPVEDQQGSLFSPMFLPDGRHFLYWVRSAEGRGIHLGQLGTKESRLLIDADPGAVYMPGHLLFIRNGTLYAQAFDSDRLELTGNPAPVAEHAATTSSTSVGLSASDAGTIAFRASGADVQQQFVWFDRLGKEVSRVGDAVATRISSPSLSRDGQRVSYYALGVNGNVDIWLLETRRGVPSLFTSNRADDFWPVWAPGGDRIVFSSNRKGSHDLYQKSVTAGGNEELLLSTTEDKAATDWSADGEFVLFNSLDPKTRSDIWALPVRGKGQPFPVVQTPFDEQGGQLSSDGHWIAYQSDESSRAEIYIQPFPGAGSRSRVSTNGGSQARWRRDGKELFYVGLDGRLMSVPIQVSSTRALEAGAPVALFDPPLGGAVQQADYRHQYMVSPDGQRFLVATVKEEPNVPITVILNWKFQQPR